MSHTQSLTFPRVRSGAVHRTGAPVLRGSVEAGTFEEDFFSVPAKGETDDMLRKAKAMLDTGRKLARDARQGRKLSVKERLLTRLTAAAVRILEEILTLARLCRGRVFPTYEHLMDKTGLGRRTVARSLNLLEAIGLLVRQRRFKRVEAEGPGPRYKQTSNVYRPCMPKQLVAYLPRWMRPPPVPVDQEQREADRHEDQQHMLKGLTCVELVRATVTSGPFAKILAQLGAGIDARERECQ